MKHEGTFIVLCVLVQLSQQQFLNIGSSDDVEENHNGLEPDTDILPDVVGGNNGFNLELLHNVSSAPQEPPSAGINTNASVQEPRNDTGGLFSIPVGNLSEGVSST